MEEENPQIKKWKKLLLLSLFYIYLSLHLGNSNSITRINRDLIFLENHKDYPLLPYLILCYVDVISQTKSKTNSVLNVIDEMIGFEELSLRFDFHKRLQNAL